MEQAIQRKYGVPSEILDERGRRLWAVVEAGQLGRGGVATVAPATGLSRTTIYQGVEELAQRSGPGFLPHERTRAPGAGRKRLVAADPQVLEISRFSPMIRASRAGGMAPSPPAWTRRRRRGRADRENRSKELKAAFGLEAFNLRDFWATEAALGVTTLAYHLMNLFRQAVLRSRLQHTLSTLHGLVLAIDGSRHPDAQHQRMLLSVPRRKRAWFSGLWSNAAAPPVMPGLASA